MIGTIIIIKIFYKQMSKSQFETTGAKLLPKKKQDNEKKEKVTRNFFDFEDIEDIDDDNISVQQSSPSKMITTTQMGNQNTSGAKKPVRKIKLQPLSNFTQLAPQIISIVDRKDFQEEETVEKKFQRSKPQENPQKVEDRSMVKKREKKSANLQFEFDSSSDQDRGRKKSQERPRHFEEDSIVNSNTREQNNRPASLLLEQSSVFQPHQSQTGRLNQDENIYLNTENQRINIIKPMVFILKRDNQWLNKLWPQFDLHYQSSNQHYVSAKLTGNNSAATFVISSSKNDFKENGPSYLGKVKANFIGNVINVYGIGYNPVDHKNKNLPIRQLLATIEYETNFFGSTRPRNFKVFVLKQGKSYYKDIEGVIPGQDEIPLNELIDIGNNKSNIIVMQNRKPEWNDKIKGFMLNFGGRVKLASIKNFILEDIDKPDTVRLIFGKVGSNQFRIDIAETINPLVGFGIVLSTFGGKIGCE